MIAMERALRVAAVIIAILGVVDPVFTWARADRPTIAVVEAGAASLTPRVREVLSRDFIVHSSAIAGAAATVFVGRDLPAEPAAVSGALVAVTPQPAATRVEIEEVNAPSMAASESRIPVSAALRAMGAAGRTLRIDVFAGAVLLDRATHAVKTNDERFGALLWPPTLSAGVSPLTVRVSDNAGKDDSLTAEAEVGAEVAAVRWKVLVVDPRPSWTSTFVRRALEADRRFDVAARVSTSRRVAMESGAAPMLSDSAALEDFSAIIVGAPDALGAADVRALESFARGRGGAVVLLMDRVDTGPFARITGAASFRDVHGVERRAIVSPSGDERRTLASPLGAMIATELAVPEGLSPGTDVLAAAGTGASSRPAVWRAPLGAGRVVVSGVLDAWRYRSREQSGFARFWTAVIGDAAAAAPPAVMVTPGTRVVRPGAPLDVRVVVRRAQLSDPSRPAPAIEARLRIAEKTSGVVSENDSRRLFQELRLWPTAERGVFAAEMRAPHTSGTYRFAADAVDATGAAIGSASADVVVRDGPAPNNAGLAAWATAHGGIIVPQTQLAELPSRLREGVSVSAQPVRVRPMRSIWWLPLFVATLGGEWWLRRRRGER